MLNSYEPTFIYLQEEDAIKAGATDMKLTLAATEKAHKMMGMGQVYNPAKSHMGLPVGSDMQTWESFFNSMPSFIGGDINIAGIKWAAEAKENAKVPGIPYGIDITILSDPKTVLPFCVLNGTLITAMRTGATAGLFAKYTAPSNTDTVTSIGCGVVGRCTVMAVAEAMPQVKKMYISDLDMSKAENIVKEYQPKYPWLELIPVTDSKAAADKSQVIITQTTSSKEFIDESWVVPGKSLVAVGAVEVTNSVAAKSDVLAVDDWNQMISLNARPVGALYYAGKITKEQVAEMTDLVLDPSKGRQNDEQFVYSSATGLSVLDIMISYELYCKAKAEGIGTVLKMYDKPLWE